MSDSKRQAEAEVEDVEDGEEEGDKIEKLDATKKQEAKQLDAMRDAGGSSKETTFEDFEKIKALLTKLSENDMEQKKKKQQREKELDSITVKPEDIEMLAFHLELEKPAAERHLRLHKGDLESALNALVVDFPELREARRLAGCAEEM
mmetsp:Transcript_6546/g.12934  ORF Transcript_6546/g.12934 Transcript_6546/m.12934 type:complete len:148 (+) Transcript_6546:181-624(+)